MISCSASSSPSWVDDKEPARRAGLSMIESLCVAKRPGVARVPRCPPRADEAIGFREQVSAFPSAVRGGPDVALLIEHPDTGPEVIR
jgi:hypothetical protein